MEQAFSLLCVVRAWPPLIAVAMYVTLFSCTLWALLALNGRNHPSYSAVIAMLPQIDTLPSTER